MDEQVFQLAHSPYEAFQPIPLFTSFHRSDLYDGSYKVLISVLSDEVSWQPKSIEATGLVLVMKWLVVNRKTY